MTTAILIKSYSGDFEWLAACLRSIQKFGTGFQEIVVVIPDTDNLDHLTAERVVKVSERGDGYMFQQVVKLHADRYTDADFVLIVDSDSLFIKPFTPATFMEGDRPIWIHKPWEDLEDYIRVAWHDVMLKCVGEAPTQEFMPRIPQMIPRWAFQAFHNFMVAKHAVETEHYILSQPERCFSEFNCLGFYLWLRHHDRFVWINSSELIPPAVVRQFWSWGGMTDEIRKEIELVNGGEPPT